jgi:hypothetical protein
MKYERIEIRISRSVRHKKYTVSTPEVSLTASIDGGQDLESAYREIGEDARVILDDLVEEEIKKFVRGG